uniref:G-protein coupled receptors family 1 profile domain-containing protein n=1 Tax=Sus scrofa TaxID=9823 RepID=A0A8D1VFW3_PIG
MPREIILPYSFNSEFILPGIFDHSSTHIFLFCLVLSIFTVVHIPMYLFLSQLSLMDFMLICTTAPKIAFNYLSGRKSISLAGYGSQIFFYVSLLEAEYFLLAAMAYDLYVAICHPLRYSVLMGHNICCLMAVPSWIISLLDGVIVIAVALSFPYCGAQEIPHFFCDVPALLTLSCTDTLLFERLMFICCVIMLLFPVAVIIASYACVIVAVVYMGSGEGHSKPFATCSSHLMVVGMYCGVAMFICMRPVSDHSCIQDKMVSAFYTILTPMLNPIIYSLHDKEVVTTLMKVLRKGKSGEQIA